MPRVWHLAVLLGALGCTKPTASPPRENGASAETSLAVREAGPAPSQGCASDADCRTWSSYCADAPCVCRVLAKAEPDPVCGSGNVTCFVDPCMRKAAACQDGRCVLVIADGADARP